MFQVIISDRIYIQKKNLKDVEQLKKLYTYKHPKNPDITLFAWCDNKDVIAFTRGTYKSLMRYLEENKYDFQIKDKTYCKSYVREEQGQIVIRKDQQDAIDAVLKSKYGGLLLCSTSFGKSIVGFCLASQSKLVTSIIVWSKGHQEQWLEEIKKFGIFKDSEVGGCGGLFNYPKFGRINIVMQQYLYSKGSVFKEYNDYTSIWVAEECQKDAANTFFDVIDRTIGKYRIGITASIDRHDGLGLIIPKIIGPVLYKNISTESPTRISCEINLVTTDFYSCLFTGGLSQQASAIHNMLVDKDRNKIIIKRILRHVKDKRLVLVMTERKEHIMLLIRMLPPEIKYCIVMANTADASKYHTLKAREKTFLEKYEDDKAFTEARTKGYNKEVDVIFGTQKIFVGVSIKPFEAGIITVPVCHNKDLFNQMVGRIERSYHGDEILLKRYGQKRIPILDYIADVEIEKFRDRIMDMKQTYPRKFKWINGTL